MGNRVSSPDSVLPECPGFNVSRVIDLSSFSENALIKHSFKVK